MSLTLKRIQSLSQPIRHLAIYDEKLYELTTPQYEILETRVMNGVEANNQNKRNKNYNQWREVK